MGRFNISALDHVAIGVVDVERSCAFYARRLGFERLIPEWDVPVVMGIGDFGLAIFDRTLHPSTTPDDAEPPSVRIMHIAFRVDREGLEVARRELEGRGLRAAVLRTTESANRVYFRDPDGHLIELTTYEV